MKIIEHVATAQTETHLPSEIIDVIIFHVRHASKAPKAIQKDLWSCCLVSRDWYDASIKHLYAAPILGSRNFPEFARTISPPVASRTRRIGLEDLLQHLDMGSLAYESKKSTTSRLISRTKTSLVSFVAPAVSFSTTSLAPLSKCLKLQQLDLSRDVYDFDVRQLMRSIRDLPELEWLSLPKRDQDAMAIFSDIHDSTTHFWPKSLTYLQLNSHFSWYTEAAYWDSFLKSLPQSLSHLAFSNLGSYELFDSMSRITLQATQVETLYIRMRGVDSTYSVDQIGLGFPNITKLTIPAITNWLSDVGHWQSISHLQMPLQALEWLILEDTPDFPFSDHLLIETFGGLIREIPRLMRLEVPEAYLNAKDLDTNEEELDEVNQELTNRVNMYQGGKRRIRKDNAGIFMNEASKNTGPGMKRSFRYRADNR